MWRSDLLIGVRLAVGGGRVSLARFVLSTAGIAVAVAVLLLGSAVPSMLEARDGRRYASYGSSERVAGVDPVLYETVSTSYLGEPIDVRFFTPTGPAAPLPVGVDRLPGEGEVFASPAAAELLAGNEVLRERFPQRVVGLLPDEAVVQPGDNVLYLRGHATGKSPSRQLVYAFDGQRSSMRDLDPGLLLLVLLGTVALLVPVFIFVTSSSRIAGFERDRRLAALRLVGADDRQVRRIAAAESLVSAAAGLVVGVGVFLLGRDLVEGVKLLGASVYSTDIVPVWWMAVLIAFAVPVLAVVAAQAALRRTIIEPLGVYRFSKPLRRSLGWRLALVLAGVFLLVWHGDMNANSPLWSVIVAAGATLMLVGVPALLPWAVERVVAGRRGGPPSWQMAVRRLQLDSGTSARVVGGVAAVLTAAIALQTVLLSQAARFPDSSEPEAGTSHYVGTEVPSEKAEAMVTALRGIDGISDVRVSWEPQVEYPDNHATASFVVMDCAMIARNFGVTDCVDGQAFSAEQDFARLIGLVPGRTVSLVEWDAERNRYAEIAKATLPERFRTVRSGDDYRVSSTLVVTPGVVPPAALTWTRIAANVDGAKPLALERARNLSDLENERSSYFWGSDFSSGADELEQTFVTIRKGLLIGSGLVLTLVCVSLLVLALEHIRERRRPLAVLAASGVPTGAIARSLLWQMVIPIALGSVIAVGTGLGLGALVVLLSSDTVVVDWAGVGVMAAVAAALGVLVSLVTLPFLRGAMRLSSLRHE